MNKEALQLVKNSIVAINDISLPSGTVGEVKKTLVDLQNIEQALIMALDIASKESAEPKIKDDGGRIIKP